MLSIFNNITLRACFAPQKSDARDNSGRARNVLEFKTWARELFQFGFSLIKRSFDSIFPKEIEYPKKQLTTVVSCAILNVDDTRSL